MNYIHAYLNSERMHIKMLTVAICGYWEYELSLFSVLCLYALSNFSETNMYDLYYFKIFKEKPSVSLSVFAMNRLLFVFKEKQKNS